MNDAQFGIEVAALLDEGLERVDGQVTTRLQLPRKAALAHAAAQPRGSVSQRPMAQGERAGGWRHWLAGPRLWLALGTIVIALTGVTWTEWSSYQDARDGAELDLAILADDLPVTAYIDNGFDSWLKRPVEPQQ